MKRRENTSSRKADYFTRVRRLFDEYDKILIVGADNVGSKQMQKIRQAVRGQAVLLMGKNTMIRKAIRDHCSINPTLEKLLPIIEQNVGFVFTKGDLADIRKKLLANRKGARSKAGSIAPCDVVIPPQTGLGPEKTSFFAALRIPTKIVRGNIEIMSQIHLISAGERVSESQAALLHLLGLAPFSYGLTVLHVYDSGTIYPATVLDLSLIDIFRLGVRNVAAVSIAIRYPTRASVSHSLVASIRSMLAIAAVTDVSFKHAKKVENGS